MTEQALTADDPQPPLGSIVEDATGVEWLHVPGVHGGTYWLRRDGLDGDPESWTKVAGNYGPVKLKAGWTDRVIHLASASLLSKWGFNDGDVPEAVMDYCDDHGIDWSDYDWHETLQKLVRTHLLPAMLQHHTTTSSCSTSAPSTTPSGWCASTTATSRPRPTAGSTTSPSHCAPTASTCQSPRPSRP